MRDDPRRAARRGALLDALGHPERGLRVIHVAGTNGKGSVAAMMDVCLQEAGRRVGLYTSPDLGGPRERFRLDGQAIAEGRLAALDRRVAPAVAAAEAAYPELGPVGAFERWCAIAWLWLAEERVDLAIVEAGVGARHDATNVFATPELAIITSIGLDHADRLGPDLAAIALEKAGVLRAGGTAITSARGKALEVLEAEAERVGARLVVAAPLDGAPRDDGGWYVSLPPVTADGRQKPVAPRSTLALAGRFQLENAGVAVAALRELDAAGWNVPDAALSAGLKAVSWPGRMERVADPDGGDWLLDGAHNAPAVDALVESWGEPAVVVAGIQSTKDAAAMVPRLTAGGRPLVALPVPGAIASWDADALANWAAGRVYSVADLGAALRLAKSLAPRGRRCVTGSLYLVGAARACLTQGAR